MVLILKTIINSIYFVQKLIFYLKFNNYK